ncbi:MAG: GHMP kinase, partial [bacterium]|nr:GHMP kinase [bacterium]
MIKTSAPGSLMVMGEHAVLHGYPALVTAINKRLNIQLTLRHDRKIFIHSALGTYQGNLDALDLEGNPSFRFVLKTLDHFRLQLTNGLDILIESEIDSTKGLGSSAALVVALVSGLYCLTNSQGRPSKKE